MIDKRVILGIGLGSVAIVAAPYVVPVIAAIARPLVKGAMKQAVIGLTRAREHLANLAEALEDILAEVRAEVDDQMGAAGLTTVEAANPADLRARAEAE